MSGGRLPRIVVIGAGIVGLCCAHHLRDGGFEVVVIDRDPAGDKASIGNAGGIAVTEILPASSPGVLWQVPRWLADPLGPLALRPLHAWRLGPWLWRFVRSGLRQESDRIVTALAALNARVYDDLKPLLQRVGLAGDLHEVGALAVYESDAGLARDRSGWERRRSHGIVCRTMSGDEARALEPALGPAVRYAVLLPAWSHLSDPRALLDALRTSLIESGVEIVTGEAVDIVAEGTRSTVRLSGGGTTTADAAVIAAGAWSAALARRIGDRAVLESERGYNVTIPEPGFALRREVIFAEHHFVATPLSVGLRIGGAAEFAGLAAPPNFARSRALLTLARRYLPLLGDRTGCPWMGHRPATPDSLPVIGRSPKQPGVFYAFGHGHLGLTQAASTGRLILDLITGAPVPIDMQPFAIERFA
jgi:D-amino-acid dehydrogenase